MDLIVYGALCPPGREHETAYRLLALLLERERGVSPLPELVRGERGKPFFPGAPGLQFNLSHSRGAAVCALHDKPVGVDVELLRKAPRRLAAGMEDGDFFRLWTAREATVKREGRGVEALLRPMEPDGLCQWLEADFLPGYAAAVCPSEPALVRTFRADGLLDGGPSEK